ncbi:MAG: hypothetical protein H7Y41_05000, partial [Hyphomonadaceae bacterium]|nr:hypothetical protein [Clostridia bacterium]
LMKIEDNISFNWARDKTPDESIAICTFSARWSGYVEGKYTEDMDLSIIADDGVRVYIDDKLVIDEWHPSSANEYTAIVPMANRQFHKIVVEYYQAQGGATCKLFWKSAGQEKEIIPMNYLYSTPIN